MFRNAVFCAKTSYATSVFKVYVMTWRYVVRNAGTHATEYIHRDTGEFRATYKRLAYYVVSKEVES